MLNQQNKKVQRRAVILMVVLAMLTLFTVVGITFVYMSDSYALSARLARGGENIVVPDVEPEQAFAFVLSQIIYDLNDDQLGVTSALRGHSLARNMYGWYPGLLNDKAYTGLGRLRYTFPNGGPLAGMSNQDCVNYQYYATDGFLIDPERIGFRSSANQPQQGTYVPCNVPYTYVDQNNMFLAFLDPASNQVKIPSYQRSWLPLTGTALDRHRSLRPTSIDNPNFPRPAADTMDVKNFDSGAGGNDSIWIDVGAPVLVASNGQKYKMLVAPLILELDSRLNLNVAGNILQNLTGAQNHAGTQGWGPWEMNIGKVMPQVDPNTGKQEWVNLFLGSSRHNSIPVAAGIPQRTLGRYGATQLPQGSWTPPNPPLMGRAWSQIDFNGVNDPGNPANAPAWGITSGWSLPNGTWNPQTGMFTDASGNPISPTFPNFPKAGYNNTYPAETTLLGTANSTMVHPLLYNSMKPAPGNRAFSPTDMAAVLRYGGTNADFLGSDLLRLCPLNLAQSTLASANTRNLVTTSSWDLNRPAPIPYIWDPADATTSYKLDTSTYPPKLQQQAITDPYSLATVLTKLAGPPPANSEFRPDWRSVAIGLNKLNLNRPLTAYSAGTAAAQRDRLQFTQDIFSLLQQVTGTQSPTAVAINSPQYNALRYLAQLSVNIVDFIDSDHVNTGFNWFGSEWVFGVELPRLVINEFYYQFGTGYVNFWLELLNPLPDKRTDPATNANLTTDMDANLGHYQMVFATTPSGIGIELNNQISPSILQQPRNNLGDPNFGGANSTQLTTPLGTTGVIVSPIGNGLNRAANGSGVCIIGPTQPGVGSITDALGKALTGDCSGLTYPFASPYTIGDTTTADPHITNMPSPPTNGLLKGMTVTGPGILANTTISNFGPGNQITLSQNAGTTQKGGTFTFFYPFTGDMTIGSNTITNLIDPTMVANIKNGTLLLVTGNGIPFNAFGVFNGGSITFPPYIKATVTQAGASLQLYNVPAPTILLQRLACPYMAAQPDPNQPNYNPYLTTDYIDVAAALSYNPSQPVDNYNVSAGSIPAGSTSLGRRQPYCALASNFTSQPKLQTVSTPPLNTFNQHNCLPAIPPSTTPLPGFFDSPVFRDRPLSTKSELLYVASCRPHELTQLFVQNDARGNVYANSQSAYPDPTTPNNVPQNVWTNPATRLYRFFEFADVAPIANGIAFAGRMPGRININMVFPNDSTQVGTNTYSSVFRSICVGGTLPNGNPAGNTFSQANVDSVYQAIVNARQPTWGRAGGVPIPSQNDTPLWGFGLGPTPSGDALTANARGLNGQLPGTYAQLPGTYANSNGTTTAGSIFITALVSTSNLVVGMRVIGPGIPPNTIISAINNANQITMSNPASASAAGVALTFYGTYQNSETLTKLMNNITTRSNVFAVWLTVGFFAVEDDTQIPPKLGAEIGVEEGRNIRHRMFAIVDRTNLQIFQTTSTAAVSGSPIGTPSQTFSLTQSQTPSWNFNLNNNNTVTTPSGVTAQLQAGSVLVFEPNDPNGNEETVVIQTVIPPPRAANPYQYQATFYKNHVAGCTVISRGNPGPQSVPFPANRASNRYDLRQDPVVLYFAIIQ